MAGRAGAKRPTITEIARLTGVSPGAVSFALNGRPGVSEETRARILGVAREIGWVPSTAARALRGGGTATIGLVITREPAMLGVEPFFMRFVAGIEQAITDRGYALLLQVTPDLERQIQTYRDWWKAGRVDGIILTDLMVDDARLAVLHEIGLPAVVAGDPEYTGGLPALGSDDAGAARYALGRLADLGHRRIAHLGGPVNLVHSRVRTDAMRQGASTLGVELIEMTTDYSLEQGVARTRDLLSLAERPTAIVCDNDLLALGAVRTARERGLELPGELSILAWDDSPLCEFSMPTLSALRSDVPAYGERAARGLMTLLAQGRLDPIPAMPAVRLVERDSLAPAPA